LIGQSSCDKKMTAALQIFRCFTVVSPRHQELQECSVLPSVLTNWIK
jgi:hypothetical protein